MSNRSKGKEIMRTHSITDRGWALECTCGVLFTGDKERGAERHLETLAAGKEDLGTMLGGWMREEFAREERGELM